KLISEAEQQKEVEQTIAKHNDILERWTQTTTRERQEILGAYMRLQIAKAIGISPSDIHMQQSIKYLGIDSLIAVKLRNQLRTDWSVDLAAVKFLDDLSMNNLVMLVEEQIENAHQQDRENPSLRIIDNDDWLEGEL
ncbi:acyl carrier protein, partial [Moorena sp. SIO3H5]|uniref:acyl carrier protein n=1 Tax=Moorena sp. SIO3H5 TaxID=2607834 RepID=UPI0013B64574